MTNAIVARLGLSVLVPIALLVVSLTSEAARGQSRLYTPLPIPDTNEINDKLSDKDIPTGDGGFARDYLIDFQDGDQVAIDLTSDNFDTIITLMAADGSTIAENDDGPDGSTNSLLFARISESGEYIIRVRAFGETGGGEFKLKVTRLRPIDD